MDEETKIKTAIVYDRVNKFGGAERVLLALNEIFPDAPLYTSLYSPSTTLWAKVFPKIIPSYLNEMAVLRDKHQLLAPLMPMAFESFNFDKFDLVISVTSEAAKGIITKPHTKHICYCLTPTRYLWSGYEDYFTKNIYKKITSPLVSYLRYWDKYASFRPDVMIAISTEVKKRIKSFYQRSSEIIFPPVDIDQFKIRGSIHNKSAAYRKLPNDGYYLIVSRLEPYKKLDLVIKAFNKLGYTLVIIGMGSEYSKLKAMAGENIILKGFMSDIEIPIFYQNAKGFIFPQEEDFGITAVESQAAGCPVIAYKKGGSLDTVIDGQTGIFFDSQNVESLISAVMKIGEMRFDKSTLQKNADKFNKKRFKKEIMDLVNKTV